MFSGTERFPTAEGTDGGSGIVGDFSGLDILVSALPITTPFKCSRPLVVVASLRKIWSGRFFECREI
jgi:hypothetical protein